MKFRRDEMRFLMKKSKCLPEGIHQFCDGGDGEECRRDTLKDLYETTNIHEAIGYYNTRYEIDFIADQTLPTEAHNDDSTSFSIGCIDMMELVPHLGPNPLWGFDGLHLSASGSKTLRRRLSRKLKRSGNKNDMTDTKNAIDVQTDVITHQVTCFASSFRQR